MKKLAVLKTISAFMLTTIAIIACTKGNNDNATIITDAVIYNSGPVAADGCGWTLKAAANDSTYSPINLTADYKVNNLKVKVRFHPLKTKFSCGWGAKLTEITIDNITRIP
ncbi:hypothetical protein GCM10027049_12290 [Mucilaginibacter puniceus]